MSICFRTVLLIFCIASCWTCSSTAPTDVEGVRAVGDHVRVYEGADLEVVY